MNCIALVIVIPTHPPETYSASAKRVITTILSAPNQSKRSKSQRLSTERLSVKDSWNQIWHILQNLYHIYGTNPMNIMNGMNKNTHFHGQVYPLNEDTDESPLCAEGLDCSNTLQCFRKSNENGTTSGALHPPHIMSGIDISF